MKKLIHNIFFYINQVHNYPFWLFLFFLYASIATFLACILINQFPNILTNEKILGLTGEILFESAFGLLVIGCITAPIMDIILHYDLNNK